MPEPKSPKKSIFQSLGEVCARLTAAAAARREARAEKRYQDMVGAKPSAWKEGLDAFRLRLTLRRWKSRARRRRSAKARFHWMKHLPHFTAFGQLCYLLGFWTELSVLRFLRGVKALFRLLAGGLAAVARRRLLPVLAFVRDFFLDIFRPVWQMGYGFAALSRARRKRGETLTRGAVLEGLRDYFWVLARGVMNLLPFAALAVLVFTVRSVQAYHYVLAVQVNGETVGTVENEQVFDEARRDVQMRVDEAISTMQAKDPGAAVQNTWHVDPTFTLVVSHGEVLDKGKMADAILSAASDQIQEATAVYVDGTLRAVTSEGERVQAWLNEFKAPYEDPGDPTLRVEFVRGIELVKGVYFTNSISSYDNVVKLLSGKEQEEKIYTVKAGDTPWTIAAANDLTLNELYALNPAMTAPGYTMPIGSELVIAQEVDFLQVKQVRTVSWEEAIPHDTVTTKSDEYAFGTTKTVVEGADGVRRITADLTFINGVQTDTQVLNTDILVQPVTEELIQGTKLASGMAAEYGSGTFIWPVPNYTYVSRWMSASHRGTDICASYGATIVAADGGVVTTAGYHSSYGNYVVINHGNGYTTLYAHMSSIAVSAGQGVSQGQTIGYVGSTGNSTGNHCHFELTRGGVRFSAQELFGGSVRTFR